jgi:hypothetical protein
MDFVQWVCSPHTGGASCGKNAKKWKRKPLFIQSPASWLHPKDWDPASQPDANYARKLLSLHSRPHNVSTVRVELVTTIATTLSTKTAMGPIPLPRGLNHGLPHAPPTQRPKQVWEARGCRLGSRLLPWRCACLRARLRWNATALLVTALKPACSRSQLVSTTELSSFAAELRYSPVWLSSLLLRRGHVQSFISFSRSGLAMFCNL